MAKKKLFVQCTKCKGTGKSELPIHLMQTLDAIGAGCGTSVEIRNFVANKYDDYVTPSAMANRLSTLKELGLAKRQPVPQATGGTEYAYKLQ